MLALTTAARLAESDGQKYLGRRGKWKANDDKLSTFPRLDGSSGCKGPEFHSLLASDDS